MPRGLTGHLVLSTLHTNDAVSALARLLDLHLEPYLIASTVEVVLAQRLVRVVCGDCSRERRLTAHERRILQDRVRLAADTLPEAVREGEGCRACRGTGYLGRSGMYELLQVSDPVREAVQARTGSAALKRIAANEGMRMLGSDGIRLISEGNTIMDEVIRMVA